MWDANVKFKSNFDLMVVKQKNINIRHNYDLPPRGALINAQTVTAIIPTVVTHLVLLNISPLMYSVPNPGAEMTE